MEIQLTERQYWITVSVTDHVTDKSWTVCHREKHFSSSHTIDGASKREAFPYAGASVENVAQWILWDQNDDGPYTGLLKDLNPWLDLARSIYSNANVENCLTCLRTARIRSRGSMSLWIFKDSSNKVAFLFWCLPIASIMLLMWNSCIVELCQDRLDTKDNAFGSLNRERPYETEVPLKHKVSYISKFTENRFSFLKL